MSNPPLIPISLGSAEANSDNPEVEMSIDDQQLKRMKE